jgi:hypothetical protein
MKALEHTAPRRAPIALAIAASLITLACGEPKPGAAPSAPHPDPADQHAPALIATSAAASDSAVVRLAAATDTTLAGTRVRLPVAHAQSVMSDRGFWIGLWGQLVYVFQAAPTPAPVQGGEAYTIVGTVRAAPHSAQGAPRGMTPIDIEAMHAQHVYIAADSVVADSAGALAH